MPRKNTVRKFVANGIYHLYNRGIGKRAIFLDVQDYRVFENRLQTIFSPDLKQQDTGDRIKNHSHNASLLAYCLMPNHYHLLVKQLSDRALPELMKTLITSYTMYFNKKHGSVGPIFDGVYRSSLIDNDEYLIHVSRYIHLNPMKLKQNPSEYLHSSLQNYKSKSPRWLDVGTVLSYFDNSNKRYWSFVNSLGSDENIPENIKLD